MLKAWLAPAYACVLALLLSACAGQPSSSVPSPEADARAPGMIPVECEALLKKSQEWGYVPGQPWKPKSLAQAREALQFFASFHFMPEAGSNFWAALARTDSPSESEAEDLVRDSKKVMACDFALSLQFLNPLVQFPWPRTERVEASRLFLRFLLAQQARSMPLLPRLAAVTVHMEAVKKGLASGSLAPLRALQAEGENAFKQLTATADSPALQQFEELKKEVQVSDRLREKMARFLPLP